MLLVFLKLGVTCFGGPIAHIGYFRDEFVVRRRWLDEQAYADLVALCQFLPGPASSQVGFSIGLMRAGYLGGLAAWTGFTLPSAIALVLFAYGAGALSGPIGTGLLHGLKLVAVAIVAQAVWGMARTLCPDRERASIAVVAALIILFSTSSVAQIGAIAARRRRRAVALPRRTRRRRRARRHAGLAHRGLRRADGVLSSCWRACRSCAALTGSQGIALFEAFYRSGALVFGGGHVVLPLLREAFVTPGWVSDDAFLAGYGAAQAVPGPLFTFAAYLGTGRQSVAARPCWRGAGSDRHLSSRYADPARHAAVLGYLPQTRRRAGHDARRQRRRRRPARRGALQSGLDQFGQRRRGISASRLSASFSSPSGARRRCWSSPSARPPALLTGI